MFEFFFRYFLVFPKIQIGGGNDASGFGILIGEAFLVLYCVCLVVLNRKMLLKVPLVILYLFIFYFIVVSSMAQFPLTGILPGKSIVYFGRLLIYLGIFHFFYNYRPAQNNEIIENFFTRPFKLQFYLGSLIIVAYYLTHSPTVNDIMWEYSTGLRMIPFGGLAFNANSFFFLKPIGGGSGNLLCSWALAVLIITDTNDSSRARKILFIVVTTVLLTLSRGGVFTIFLYVLYMTLRGKLITFQLLGRFLLFGVFIIFILYWVGDRLSIFSNVFARIEGTFQGGRLDPSSLDRIKNYIAVITPWIQNPYHILFGLGYDEAILEYYTDHPIVESFFLQVIVSSGLLGLTLFALLYYAIYKLSKINIWFNSLWKFFIFESILQWSITGGDFLSPHVMFTITALLGLGYREMRINQILS